MNHELLQQLFTRLKACPAHDTSLSRERFLEGWDRLRREDITPLINPTAPIMAALVLSNDTFASLLLETERAQLLALVNVAIDRYDQKTNPPNQLGKLLADIIKK